MTRRTFFCEHIDSSEKVLKLSKEVSHHVARVHRHRPGDRIEIIDGRGARWTAEILAVSPADGRVTVTLIDRKEIRNESPLNLVIMCALARSDKMDLLVRQTTELGVKGLIFFKARMSVSAPDPDRAAAKVERWKRIAREALCQCGRTVEPEIACVNSLAVAIECAKEYVKEWNNAVRLVAYEKEERVLLRNFACNFEKVSEACCCIGPEGGLSKDEMECLSRAGFLSVSLGPRILRYETAGVVLAGICQYLWGDMGNSERSLP